ncbi:hypothetical protein [Streptomyces sp. VRA16 Mangrove soil]|uniref:hypothetical protein n=1 Tax=Streptomyces sp. VRA16 Mangrove soil TaxID=2817434 RepID=UPI001A9D1111|nr:hypothetical protein [Streptomyces sp. VRA16 Mangrove soil]MBO1332162.1 hypothetical protein [Streptomyces sp. VRA16 Mangrove soil]
MSAGGTARAEESRHRGAPHIDIAETLDWRRFAAEHWDRRPVLIRGSGVPHAPFDLNEVFETAVVAAHRAHTPDRIRFTAGQRRLVDPGDLLPRPEDGSFDAYDRRLAGQLTGESFSLEVRGLHSVHHPLWARERAFLSGLWRRVGQPGPCATTTLCHGAGEPTASRTHQGATFLYLVAGPRRLWIGRDGRWSVADATPGDLVYWPAGHRHTTEPGPEPATQVRIGVPRAPARPGSGLRTILAPGPNPLSPQGGWGGDGIHVPDGEPPDDLPAGLPPVFAAALDHFRQAARPAAAHGWVAREALRQATNGGLGPVPPPARPGYFTDDDAVRATERVLWSAVGGRRLVAACGHVLETDLSAPELSAVLGLLNSGEPVQVGELTPPARSLMSRLSGFRAVERL